MRSPGSSTITAIAKRVRAVRQLLYLIPKNAGVDAPVGFWNGVGSITTNVIDGYTRSSVSRTFHGLGSVGGLDEIPMLSGLQVREITISLSNLDDDVMVAIRGYSMRFAPAQFYFGFLDIESRVFVDPPYPLIVGEVDAAPIITKAGGGEVQLKIVSQLRELTKPNPEKRDQFSQQRRLSSDTFYNYAGEVDRWQVPWGVAKAPIVKKHNPKGKDKPKR